MTIPNFLKIPFIKNFLGNIAKSNDTKTTVLGVIAATLIGSSIDWGKLLNGDLAEIGKAVGAVVAAVFGYYSNKNDAKPSGAGPEVPKSNPQA